MIKVSYELEKTDFEYYFGPIPRLRAFLSYSNGPGDHLGGLWPENPITLENMPVKGVLSLLHDPEPEIYRQGPNGVYAVKFNPEKPEAEFYPLFNIYNLYKGIGLGFQGFRLKVEFYAGRQGTKTESLFLPLDIPKLFSSLAGSCEAQQLDRDILKFIITDARYSDIDKYLPFLDDNTFRQFGLDTPRKKAAFISQIAYESQFLQKPVENLNYSAKGLMATFGKLFPSLKSTKGFVYNPEALASKLYEGERGKRLGLGNENPGDGYNYRGRGLIHITGRYMYERIGTLMQLDLVAQPALLEDPRNAALSAYYYWQLKSTGRNLSDLAEQGNINQITKIVSNSTKTAPQRKKTYNKAVTALTECPSQRQIPYSINNVNSFMPFEDMPQSLTQDMGKLMPSSKAAASLDIITGSMAFDSLMDHKLFRDDIFAESTATAPGIKSFSIQNDRRFLAHSNLPYRFALDKGGEFKNALDLMGAVPVSGEVPCLESYWIDACNPKRHPEASNHLHDNLFTQSSGVSVFL